MLKLKLQYFGHLLWRVDSLEKTLTLGEIGTGGEGDDRGWDGWKASPTRWTWVWVISGSWRWTGRPGVLHFMGSQRVGHDWETELNWRFRIATSFLKFIVPSHFANAVNKIKLRFMVPGLQSIVVEQSLSCVWLFLTPWTATHQASLFFTISQSLLKFMSTVLVMLSKLHPSLSSHGLWSVALQAPLSVGFPRQEYWSGLPFPFPGDLTDPGIESGSLALQADSIPTDPPRKPKPTFIMSI